VVVGLLVMVPVAVLTLDAVSVFVFLVGGCAVCVIVAMPGPVFSHDDVVYVVLMLGCRTGWSGRTCSCNT